MYCEGKNTVKILVYIDYIFNKQMQLISALFSLTGINSWGFDHMCWLEKPTKVCCQLELTFPLGREIVMNFSLEQNCCNETIIINILKQETIISYAGNMIEKDNFNTSCNNWVKYLYFIILQHSLIN